MSNPLERKEGIELTNAIKKFSYENVRFNFYETAPVQKKILTLSPNNVNIAITHITYSLGSMDLSANGYVQLILSKIDNPNAYATLQTNSQIILDVMGGASYIVNDQFMPKDPYVLNKGETIYGFLYSNIPADVMGKLSIFYIPMFD